MSDMIVANNNASIEFLKQGLAWCNNHNDLWKAEALLNPMLEELKAGRLHRNGSIAAQLLQVEMQKKRSE